MPKARRDERYPPPEAPTPDTRAILAALRMSRPHSRLKNPAGAEGGRPALVVRPAPQDLADRALEILVLASEPSYFKSLSLLLPWNVRTADSFNGAVKRIRRGVRSGVLRRTRAAFDALIIEAPSDGGALETVSRLHYEFPNLIVILVSTQDDEVFCQAAKTAGATWAFVKGSVEPKQLDRALRDAIREPSI